MNNAIPKQFLLLNGRPVLMHTIERFSSMDAIVVVLPAAQIETWKSLVSAHCFTAKHTVTAGGTSRYLSVKNGLAMAGDEGIIAVHDGVRPLVSEELIARCVSAAEDHGTAIPVISVPESVRSKQDGGSKAEDRSRFMLVQTPQCFRASYAASAYSKEDDAAFTDDATVLEAAGIPIHLVDGERWNIKVTFPEDLEVAAGLLKK